MSEIGKWEARSIEPKDNFEDSTLSVFEWMKRETEGVDERLKWSMFVQAIAAYSRHELCDGELVCAPHVGYDIESDNHYFIFKQKNNGATFVVRQAA